MNLIIASCIVLLFILLALGIPFYVAFLASSMPILFWVAGQGPLSLASLGTNSIQGFTLIAIPLFILLGNIMAVSGATTSLFEVARAFIGRLPGGLGMATIVACAMFGTMCGSGVATALAIGSIAVPELVKNGYSRESAAAICGCAGGLGMIIPPSIAFVILGDVLSVSVGDLFIAGIVPGVICTAFLCVACYILVRSKVRRGEIKLDRVYSWREKRKTLVAALPLVAIPVVILYTLWRGVATPTEVAGVSCVVATLLARFYFHKFGRKEIQTAFSDTVQSAAPVFCIIVGSVTFGRALAYMFIPQKLGALAGSMGLGLNAFKLVIFGIFGILGMFLDGFILWLVCLPPLVPSFALYPTMDLVYFGVLFQFMVMLGALTPPTAIQLYSAATGAKAEIAGTLRESPLYMLAIAMSTLLLLFVPALVIY